MAYYLYIFNSFVHFAFFSSCFPAHPQHMISSQYTVAFSVLILPFPAIGTAPEFLCVSRMELFPPVYCLHSCSALARHHCVVLNWTG